MTQEETPITVKLDYIQRDIQEIKMKLENDYVTRSEFSPVKNLVFGLAGIILSSVFIALVTLVLRK
jgi:hypothetical protein